MAVPAGLAATATALVSSWKGRSGEYWIKANLSGAWVYVNGRLFSRVPLTSGTTSFTGIEVSSGGTVPVGDDMFIDQFRAS